MPTSSKPGFDDQYWYTPPPSRLRLGRMRRAANALNCLLSRRSGRPRQSALPPPEGCPSRDLLQDAVRLTAQRRRGSPVVRDEPSAGSIDRHEAAIGPDPLGPSVAADIPGLGWRSSPLEPRVTTPGQTDPAPKHSCSPEGLNPRTWGNAANSSSGEPTTRSTSGPPSHPALSAAAAGPFCHTPIRRGRGPARRGCGPASSRNVMRPRGLWRPHLT